MIHKIWSMAVNRETCLYVAAGVMTTLVDWAGYALFRMRMDYRLATAAAWALAVVFAYVVNKFFVFCSMSMDPRLLWKEFSSFVACRVATGLVTLAGMIAMVDGLGIKQDMICKVANSVISLALNYLFSKLIIFKKRKQ